MQESNKFLAIQAAAIILLLIAIGEHPTGFYQLTKIVVCPVALYAAHAFGERNLRGWAFSLACVALIFNPVFPIHQTKEAWRYADFLAASVIFCSIFAAAEKGFKRSILASLFLAPFFLMPAGQSNHQQIAASVSTAASPTVEESARNSVNHEEQNQINSGMCDTGASDELVPPPAMPLVSVPETSQESVAKSSVQSASLPVFTKSYSEPAKTARLLPATDPLPEVSPNPVEAPSVVPTENLNTTTNYNKSLSQSSVPGTESAKVEELERAQ